MTHSLAHLNRMLAEAFGSNPLGEAIFQWRFSEDMHWPEFATGGMVEKAVKVPVIGGEDATAYISIPEYRKEKMCPHLDRQWLVTIWMPQESLGAWQAKFPGAVYPARGYRIMTNASLPSYPGGPREPNLNDTEHFIRELRWQRSHTQRTAEQGIDNERTVRDAAIKKEIEDEIRDDFPALMNIEPGNRGGYVSFPYSKKDRLQ